MVGKEGREIGRHVGKIVSREAPGHLLKRDDIRSIETLRNTAEIINPIKTEAVLYVIARKLTIIFDLSLNRLYRKRQDGARKKPPMMEVK
ncbi:hypothetical protein AJ87_33370 [Rhizobium yanglingense]|nr:hypothetical protein AJ87_33370 [Rhizobium yanglingense]